jgi:hypothetical protein
MKKIIYFSFALVAFASCKKDRTCSCTETGTQTTTYTFPTTGIVTKFNTSTLTTSTYTGGPITTVSNTSSIDNVVTKKVTKKAMKAASGNLSCQGELTEYTSSYTSQSIATGGFLYSTTGGDITVSTKSVYDTKCTLK